MKLENSEKALELIKKIEKYKYQEKLMVEYVANGHPFQMSDYFTFPKSFSSHLILTAGSLYSNEIKIMESELEKL